MLEWFQRRFAIRFVVGLIILCATLTIMGVIEGVRCARWLIPATEVTLAGATGADGLASFGHVRITDADISPDLAVRVRRDGSWSGAYATVVQGEGGTPGAGGVVVAWFADARSPADVAQYMNDHGLEGFVEGRADFINPGDLEAIRGRTGPDMSRCWVLRLRRPSWLKATLLLCGGVGLTAFSGWMWVLKERGG